MYSTSIHLIDRFRGLFLGCVNYFGVFLAGQKNRSRIHRFFLDVLGKLLLLGLLSRNHWLL